MSVYDYLLGYVFLLLELFNCKSQQNIKLDPNTDFLVPIGSKVTITCTKHVDGEAFGWRTTLSNGQVRFGTVSRNNLASLGVDLTYPNENVAIIAFNTTDDGITSVRCQFTALSDGTVTTSKIININIFGPPQIPTNITFTRSNSTLKITWAVPTVLGVSTTFIVKLSKIKEDQSVLTDVQSYQFDVPNGICGPYEVEIVASNQAGSSSASASRVFSRMLEDLCYFVSTDKGNILLTVLFNASKCDIEEYVSFEINVIQGKRDQSLSARMTVTCLQHSVDDQFICRDVILSRNSYYTFHIRASSTFGIQETDPVEISTHGIQEVFLTHTMMNDTYIVTCTFLTSSDAQGCSYVLSGTGSFNVSGTIIRTSRNSGSVQVFIEDLQNYSVIIACEINMNNRKIDGNHCYRSYNIFETKICTVVSDPITVKATTGLPFPPIDIVTSHGNNKNIDIIFVINIIATVSVAALCRHYKEEKFHGMLQAMKSEYASIQIS